MAVSKDTRPFAQLEALPSVLRPPPALGVTTEGNQSFLTNLELTEPLIRYTLQNTRAGVWNHSPVHCLFEAMSTLKGCMAAIWAYHDCIEGPGS